MRLKELRKQKKWTLAKLSEKTHIAINTLSQYETGKREPSFDILFKLAEIFNVSVDYLLGRDKQQNQLTNNETQIKPNTIVVFGRNEGKTEYQVSEAELNAIKALLEARKNIPDDDNF